MRKVKGTLHWVAAHQAVDCEVRIYENLFTEEFPEADGRDFMDSLNPDSLKVLHDAKAEPATRGREPGWSCQFFRHGYFVVDPDSTEDRVVFNRTVALRDTWAKIAKKLDG